MVRPLRRPDVQVEVFIPLHPPGSDQRRQVEGGKVPQLVGCRWAESCRVPGFAPGRVRLRRHKAQIPDRWRCVGNTQVSRDAVDHSTSHQATGGVGDDGARRRAGDPGSQEHRAARVDDRGAAGGGILNAELLVKQGYITK